MGHSRTMMDEMKKIRTRPSLDELDPSLGALGPSLGALGPSLGALGPSLGALGPSLGALITMNEVTLNIYKNDKI